MAEVISRLNTTDVTTVGATAATKAGGVSVAERVMSYNYPLTLIDRLLLYSGLDLSSSSQLFKGERKRTQGICGR